jgi:hypothetical protein
MTIFHAFNKRIVDFVRRSENARLAPGTGTFSTPFRGTLFGCELAADVEAALENRRVDVLWLGANPNVQTSVDAILGKSVPQFQALERQMESNFYGEVDVPYWERAGEWRVGWDPVGKPQRGWKFYQDTFARVRPNLAIAMANIVPWGSSDASTFWEPLAKLDSALVTRVVEFCDQLNEYIVEALRPRLLVVPLSLGERTGLARSRATTSVHEIPLSKRTFRFHTGSVERRGRVQNIAYLPHPMAIQYRLDERAVISDRLVGAVGAMLAQ